MLGIQKLRFSLLTKMFLYGRLLYIGTEKTKNESEAENEDF